jgi:hypothetical protein
MLMNPVAVPDQGKARMDLQTLLITPRPFRAGSPTMLLCSITLPGRQADRENQTKHVQNLHRNEVFSAPYTNMKMEAVVTPLAGDKRLEIQGPWDPSGIWNFPVLRVWEQLIVQAEIPSPARTFRDA